MKFSDNAMSAILLCSYIGLGIENKVKPFSLMEWNKFLDKVIERKCEPSVVLNQDLSILKDMHYSDDELERIQQLVLRGAAVAFELDELQKKGIGVITLFDGDYPVLLKRKLKRKMPPVLFYAGDINLAKKIGIAVVGSRDVDENGMEFTKKLVEKAAKERLIVYSGGARGVDTVSEKAAIQYGSAVVSFVADSLLTKIKKKDILNNIIQGKMLLLSDVKPDVGFTAARAMNRNKYIYAASYGAFVVSSDYNKGGTWSGATETLKNDWTKVLVWNHKEYNGNLKLIEKGGIPYDLSDEKIYDVITKKHESYDQLDFFKLEAMTMVKESSIEYSSGNSNNDLYNIVSAYIVEQLGGGLDVNEASRRFNVAKGQMNVWLKRLCEEGKVKLVKGVYIRK